MNIVYRPNKIINLTGNTNDYISANSAITSDIYIISGFTFNINDFDRNSIDRISIIDNIINYVTDGISKYTLDVLIVNSGNTYLNVTEIGDYCVKISYQDITNYFIMNILLTDYVVLTQPINYIITTTTTTYNNLPYFLYNSGETWKGGDRIIPYNVYLHLEHDNIIGWTVESLKMLFINRVVNCSGDIVPLTDIIFVLFKDGIMVNGIIDFGIYDIYITYTDYRSKNVTNYISNIKVNDLPPTIFYYNLMFNLTGNTSDYCVNSAITSDIYIPSGFTLNLTDNSIIDRLSIINNIVEFVYDFIDTDLNKYMLNVLIVDSGQSYINVVSTGDYCVKFSLTNSSGNEVINYILMKVVFDISVYSEGYWIDNKIWIDRILWLDHPKNSYLNFN